MAWERNYVLGSSASSENKSGGEMVMSIMEFCSVVNSARHWHSICWGLLGATHPIYRISILFAIFQIQHFKKNLFSTKKERKEGRNKESISICKLSDFLCIIVFPWYKSFELNCCCINNYSFLFSSQIFFLSSLLN